MFFLFKFASILFGITTEIAKNAWSLVNRNCFYNTDNPLNYANI